MSILVAVRVGEGLVLAADSASTLMVQTSEGQVGVGKIFNHATKLLQLRDYPIGVGTWGAGNIGDRTISSLVSEFANSRRALSELGPDDINVRSEAEGLLDSLCGAYEGFIPDWREKAHPQVGMIVGGYSGNAFFPEEYVFLVPEREFIALREPGPEGQQDFGANWYGMTDAIVRLHHGRDEKVPQILVEEGIDKAVIERLMERLHTEAQYQIPFGGMPLQDAIDYAMYLVGVTVGRYRFVLGAESCGGPIDVAMITRDRGFQWVQQKQLRTRPFGPQV